ncbi:uracil-DNA glycosylase [Seongchinamella sediminis]|uniref:uracil-DNA glycosylase n=1 Tax=Seongchinamella sediminis TaxID=2283635 RepID=UPI001966F1B3|nr:uracil-DNA glycosylase [Seongchinamella sediminis]
MTERTVKLEPSWLEPLAAEFEQPYMQQLRAFLQGEKAAGKRIFPAGDEMFSAFDHTPLDAVKVVILGQDPYHGEGQAHGLCFSVRPGTRVPPSLQNIYKEINAELGLPIPDHGYLTHWADQGVLLLNSVLSVESARAASHQGKGWESFTDRVIEIINTRREGVVFMLWGSYAQRKGAIIDRQRHCVLTAPHPSPLSAHRGFFGCGHFRAANEYLQDRGQAPIDWSLPALA